MLGDVRNSEIPPILLGHQSLLSANERNSEEKTSSLFARSDQNAGHNPGKCRIVVIDRQCITFLLNLNGAFRTGRRPETMVIARGMEIQQQIAGKILENSVTVDLFRETSNDYTLSFLLSLTCLLFLSILLKGTKTRGASLVNAMGPTYQQPMQEKSYSF